MNANTRLLPIRNRAVSELEELGAAAAHLDGNVAKSGAAELNARGLAVIRTTDRFQLACGVLLEFLYGHPQSILA
jgi:hypothetical protein